MEGIMAAPGTPVKNFQTPTRPLSQNQLQSLRGKIVREAPSLYRHKVLSDPTRQVDFAVPNDRSEEELPSSRGSIHRFTNESKTSSRWGAAQLNSTLKNSEKPAATHADLDLLPDDVVREEEDDLIQGVYATDKLYEFENPALAAFTSRMINKELEIRKLLTNLVAVILWNLLSKFASLFIQSTTRGTELRDQLYRIILKEVVYKINPHAKLTSIWFQLLSWHFITGVFHLIVLFNISTCLWNLLVKSQNLDISDLNLNERQKRLLGIDVDSRDRSTCAASSGSQQDTDFKKNEIADANIDSNPLKNELGLKSSHTPFIFKSLQTPTKLREQKLRDSSKTTNQSQVTFSLQSKRVNAFGVDSTNNQSAISANNYSTTRSQPTARSSYIPSNRYTYMMESPCSTKKR